MLNRVVKEDVFKDFNRIYCLSRRFGVGVGVRDGWKFGIKIMNKGIYFFFFIEEVIFE